MARNSYWDSTILSLEVLNNRHSDFMNRCSGLIINRKTGWKLVNKHTSFNANNSLASRVEFPTTIAGTTVSETAAGNAYVRMPQASVAATVQYYWCPTNSETGANGIIGTGDFTLSFWYVQANQAANNLVQLGSSSTGFIAIRETGASTLQLVYGTTASNTSSSTVAEPAAYPTEHHIALVRSGSTLTLYINGTSVITATTAVNISVPVFAIGGDFDAAVTANANLSRIFLAKTALYTANFTPNPLVATEYTNTFTFTLDESLTDTLYDIQAIEMNSLNACGFMRLDTTGLTFPYTVNFTHGASEHFYVLIRPAKWGQRFKRSLTSGGIGTYMTGRKADNSLHLLQVSTSGVTGSTEPDWATSGTTTTNLATYTYVRAFHPGAIIGPFPRDSANP